MYVTTMTINPGLFEKRDLHWLFPYLLQLFLPYLHGLNANFRQLDPPRP